MNVLTDELTKKRDSQEPPRKTVFLVDDDMVNLSFGYDVLAPHYNVFTLNSGVRLLKTLQRHTPDLILLDVDMPEMNGYDTIAHLKEKEETEDIPVIFLTAKNDVDDELKGLSLGAIDYITKPFSPSLLLKRIEVHLLVEIQRKKLETQKLELIQFNNNLQEIVNAKTKTAIELQDALMDVFSELIEYRDDTTGGHIGRTREYLEVLLEAMRNHPLFCEDTEDWDTMLILQSAQLHDVGKIAIKDHILKKPGKLTDEEFEIIKSHVSFGEQVINKIMSHAAGHVILEHAKIMVAAHHEKWDGSGYPKGLKGKEIPLQGRMMAIVDVYDALISKRPYKEAFSHKKAVGIIADGSGEHFDPDLVDIFLNVENKFKEIAARYGEAQSSGASKLQPEQT